MTLETKKRLSSQRKTLRRKPSGFRGTTQIAPSSRPDAPFGVQQPLCPDAAVLGEALPAARRPRTLGSGAIGPGDPCRRLPPPAGSLRAPVSVPLHHCFGTYYSHAAASLSTADFRLAWTAAAVDFWPGLWYDGPNGRRRTPEREERHGLYAHRRADLGAPGVSGGFPPDRHLSDGGGGYHTAVSAHEGPGRKAVSGPDLVRGRRAEPACAFPLRPGRGRADRDLGCAAPLLHRAPAGRPGPVRHEGHPLYAGL